ncbi:MAG: phospholipid carrier-dependent glycosyltransferase [Spartobacteria bacterium]|nr:phospholipid carrier-dependent glycosyltransferase [Spartobacteria bacterium]
MSIFQNFTVGQQVEFVFAALMILMSGWSYMRQRDGLALLFLTLGGLLLRVAVISFDPFINEWDERFHALVAKNMLEHPFVPMLIKNPVLAFDYTDWTSNHVWLHNPPLFLWIIALSYKVFGINEMALRIPSLLMSSLLIPIIYRMGLICANRAVAYAAAFLYSVSLYSLLLLTGFINLDHNDIAFVFFVTLSIWCFFEYWTSKKWVWLIPLGVTAGAAALTKWLTGFLIFGGWGIAVLCDAQERTKPSAYLKIVLSFFFGLFVFLPWQIYAMKTYPAEYAFVREYYTMHVQHALDGHTGTIWFHFDMFKEQYGRVAYYLIIPALILFLIKLRNRGLAVAGGFCIGVVYVFFSFFVKTKMSGFCYIVCSLMYLALGYLLTSGLQLIKKRCSPSTAMVLILLMMSLVGWKSVHLRHFARYHADGNSENSYRINKEHNLEVYALLKDSLPSDTVLFNCGGYNHIDAMFYTDFTAYSFVPSVEQMMELKQKGITCAAFDHPPLPPAILSDNQVIKINELLYY